MLAFVSYLKKQTTPLNPTKWCFWSNNCKGRFFFLQL